MTLQKSSIKIGRKLSRLRTIAAVDIDSDAIAGSDANATYTYPGAGTVVKVAYPDVTNTLALTYGTSANSYPGFDPTSRLSRYARACRFGQIAWQRWLRMDGSAADTVTPNTVPPKSGTCNTGNLPAG